MAENVKTIPEKNMRRLNPLADQLDICRIERNEISTRSARIDENSTEVLQLKLINY